MFSFLGLRSFLLAVLSYMCDPCREQSQLIKTTANFWTDAWKEIRMLERPVREREVFGAGCMRVSVLSVAPHFDFGSGFPQDLMHDLLRGPLEPVLCRFLLTMVQLEKTTVVDILSKFRTLSRRWRWRDAPPQYPAFSLDNLRNDALDGSASETLTLCMSLPSLFPEVFQSVPTADGRLAGVVGLCCAGFRLLKLCLKTSFTPLDVAALRCVATGDLDRPGD